MEKSPPPLSLAAALALPLSEGRRSAEVFVDGDLEIRLYAPTVAKTRKRRTTGTSCTSSLPATGNSG